MDIAHGTVARIAIDGSIHVAEGQNLVAEVRLVGADTITVMAAFKLRQLETGRTRRHQYMRG